MDCARSQHACLRSCGCNVFNNHLNDRFEADQPLLDSSWNTPRAFAASSLNTRGVNITIVPSDLIKDPDVAMTASPNRDRRFLPRISNKETADAACGSLPRDIAPISRRLEPGTGTGGGVGRGRQAHRTKSRGDRARNAARVSSLGSPCRVGNSLLANSGYI